MTKPWEQEWKDVGGPCGGRIVNDADEVLADEVAEEALPIMLAAPDMARALMALEDHNGRLKKSRKDGTSCVFCLARFTTTHTPDCPVDMARSALRKAGVIP